MLSSVEDSTLEEIESFYYSNGHSSVVRVCPLAHPSLIELAKKRGYVLNGFSYRWILDLASWQSLFDAADPRVHIASPDEEIAWASTSAAGFADVDDVPEGQNLDLDRAFFRVPNNTPMVAVENGEIAASGILALNNEIAVLYTTSTRPSYRKHGLQTALLDLRLRFAQEHGARIATIETDPGANSQRNAERIGFRLAYVTAQLIKPIGA